MPMTKLIAVRDGKLAVRIEADRPVLPDSSSIAVPEQSAYRFRMADTDYIAFAAEDISLPGGYIFEALRPLYKHLNDTDFAAAGKGEELVFWDIHNRFCGTCGTTLHRNGPISKSCPKCSREIFPAVSPAIIVLVTKDDQALLVHAKSFTRPFFGLVAGFVETGESLEECVAREVMEETSLTVTNIRYFGSQPWPYPAQLMIGFRAEYVDGKVQFIDGELSAGGFFTRDSLPPLPPPPSIARRLVDEWLNETDN